MYQQEHLFNYHFLFSAFLFTAIVSVLHDLSEAKDPVITLDSTYTDVTPAIKIEISLQLLQNLCKDMEPVGTSSVLYSRVADLFEKCLDKK